jgi:hypothetical protein
MPYINITIVLQKTALRVGNAKRFRLFLYQLLQTRERSSYIFFGDAMFEGRFIEFNCYSQSVLLAHICLYNNYNLPDGMMLIIFHGIIKG